MSSRSFLLPGMGATSEMYRGAWRTLPNAVFLDWPTLAGDSTPAAADPTEPHTNLHVGPDLGQAGATSKDIITSRNEIAPRFRYARTSHPSAAPNRLDQGRALHAGGPLVRSEISDADLTLPALADHVIPLPATPVDHVFDAGHLLAMTHPHECVAALRPAFEV